MADRPRILHVITRWLRGGAEAKTLAELEGLRDRYDIALAHGAEADVVMAARVDSLGLRRTSVGSLRHLSPAHLPGAVRALRALLRAERPDVVHVHSTEAGIAGRMAARSEGVPAVHTLHGLPFGPGRHWALRPLVIAAERSLASATVAYAANSDAITRAYLEAGIGRPAQYRTIPSGIDLDAVAKAAPCPLPGAPPRVLFAGRLARGKGLEALVGAAEALRAQGSPLHLLVAGDGPLAPWLRTRPRPWLHPLGHRDDLPSVLKGCDLLALASVAEGTPRVVTEAMACGVPVLATRVGGLSDQLGEDEAGLLIPPMDDRALRDALARLLADPALRARLAREGLRRASKFSLEEMLERTDALYRDVLRGSSG